MYELLEKHEFRHEKLMFNKTNSLNTVSWPRWLIADFTPQRGEFIRRPSLVTILMDKVELRQASVRVILSLSFHTCTILIHSSIENAA